ncbi:MAG: hypothetical protein MI922_04115 [Bacteroidales bacterium]|nr:hypothetical protein [Bacteroidales bacterium]
MASINRINQLWSLFKQTVKKDLSNIISPIIVGGVIAISTLVLNRTFNRFVKPKEQVILGLTSHPTFEMKDQLNLLENSITKPVNQLLGKNNQQYEFITSIRGNFEYDELFESLYHSRVDLGFFSPFAYIESYLTGDERIQKFKYIGQKYMPTGKYYYSGFVLPANKLENIAYSSYSQLCPAASEEIMKYLEDTTKTYVFNKKKNSTSTYIIPNLIARTYKIPLKRVCYLDRHEFVQLLKKNIDNNEGCNGLKHVGFLSTDDWLYACEIDSTIHDHYSFIFFDEFPIPYDPVFVNRKAWRKKGRKETILKLLRQWIYTGESIIRRGDNNEWLRNNEDFIRLVFSAGVRKVEPGQNSETFMLNFLDAELHRRMLDSVKYTADSILSLGFYTRDDNPNRVLNNGMKYKYGFKKSAIQLKPGVKNNKMEYVKCKLIRDFNKDSCEVKFIENGHQLQNLEKLYVVPKLDELCKLLSVKN